MDQKPEQATTQHALLYLAAAKAGDQKLAGAQWQALLTAQGKGGRAFRRLADMLAGRRPLNVDWIRRLSSDPDQKRVLLAVVAKRYPETKKDLLPLARKLDFSPDATSLCLRTVLD